MTRYVAEGRRPLDQLLVITFGRAASQELRERVREQLVAAERALADPSSADRDHPVVATLLDAGRRRGRRSDTRRLRDALAVVRRRHDRHHPPVLPDRCCARSASPATPTPAPTLVEYLDDLVVEVVDDVYLRRFGQPQAQPPFGRGPPP